MLIETEYNKFLDMDVSGIKRLALIWAAIPWVDEYSLDNSFYSHGEVHSIEQRDFLYHCYVNYEPQTNLTLAISKEIRDRLCVISKDDFFDILKKSGFLINKTKSGVCYAFMKEEDLIRFFYIMENIDEF